MKYQLVLQFPTEQIDDFDAMLRLEFDLGVLLGDEHIVVGHEFGAQALNLFINTPDPQAAFSQAQKSLSQFPEDSYIAAYKEAVGESYTVIFPAGQPDAFDPV